jgi:hypothetical protein
MVREREGRMAGGKADDLAGDRVARAHGSPPAPWFGAFEGRSTCGDRTGPGLRCVPISPTPHSALMTASSMGAGVGQRAARLRCFFQSSKITGKVAEQNAIQTARDGGGLPTELPAQAASVNLAGVQFNHHVFGVFFVVVVAVFKLPWLGWRGQKAWRLVASTCSTRPGILWSSCWCGY